MTISDGTLLSSSHKYWRAGTNGGHRYATEEWLQRYADEILSLIPHGGMLLDIGCGSCELSTYLASAFTKVYGIDISSSMLSAAKNRISELRVMNLELRQGSTEQFPSDVGTVDAIFSYGVVQYLSLEDLVRHLEQCRRALSQNGVVCVANVPDETRRRSYYYGYLIPDRYRRLSMMRRWMELTQRRIKGYLSHDLFWDGIGNWFRRSDITRIADAAGFNVEFHDALYYDYRFHALLRPKPVPPRQ